MYEYLIVWFLKNKVFSVAKKDFDPTVYHNLHGYPYLVILMEHSVDLIEALSILGKKDWELVVIYDSVPPNECVLETPEMPGYYFKRRV